MDLRFTPEEMRGFFHTQTARCTREASQRGEHVSKEDEVAAQRIMNGDEGYARCRFSTAS